jgi:hypothetical protein
MMVRKKRMQFWGEDENDDSLVQEILRVRRPSWRCSGGHRDYKEQVPFGEIPEKLWRGEACRSIEHFQGAHRHCWPDYDLTPDFQLMAMHFELIK